MNTHVLLCNLTLTLPIIVLKGRPSVAAAEASCPVRAWHAMTPTLPVHTRQWVFQVKRLPQLTISTEHAGTVGHF